MREDQDASRMPYAADVAALLSRLATDRVVERVWQGDASLWYPSLDTQRRIADRLGWLDLPRPDSANADHRLSVPADEALRVIAPDIAGSIYRLWSGTAVPTAPKHVLLDSVDPRSIPEQVPRGALTLTTNGSRSVELDSLLALQWGDTLALEVREPRLTDRWATLSPLGWIAARLAGHNVEELATGAAAMRRRCQSADDPGDNEGLALAVLLAVMAQRGRDKLTLLAAPRWQPLAQWIASFVGGSLCKHRRGFVLITDEPLGPAACYGGDRCFVVLDSAATPDPLLQRHAAELSDVGHPVIPFRLDGPAAIAAEVMRWQVAVAICASIIGVNPFDEPDTDALQAALRKRLSESHSIGWPSGVSPSRAARAMQGDLSSAAPRTILIAAYFSPGLREQQALAALRQALLEQGIASAVMWPWRDGTFATQQGHAGRSDNIVLALVGALPREVEQAHVDIARVAAARLAIDLRAWTATGRRLVHVDLGSDPAAGLGDLRRALTFSERDIKC